MFKSEAHKWVELFCSIYQTKHVTPYIHALAMHVHEFLNLYGSLSKFSQQGLEKLNVTGYGKRAHFAQELIFQNNQLKLVTPSDFVHNSDSVNCYKFSQEYQFFML